MSKPNKKQEESEEDLLFKISLQFGW